jgi:hypothetical protein
VIELLRTAKRSLTHVSSHRWDFILVQEFWGKRAYGKACTHYWIRLTSSLLGLVILLAITGVLYILRLALITFLWFLGFRWWDRSSLFKLNDPIEPCSYRDYKVRSDGSSRSLYAPWEVAVGAAIGTFMVMRPEETMEVAVGYLLVVLFLLACGVILFAATKSWKLPLIVVARRHIAAAWDKVCPPLVITEQEEED